MPPISIAWRELGPKKSTVAGRADAPREAIADSALLREFLSSAAAERRPIVLLLNDSHRATRTREALEALALCIAALDARPKMIALIAAGTHRFAPAEREQFESATFRDCGLTPEFVAWHDATDAAALAPLGEFRLHRLVAEHARLLPIGSVEPHYFAGLTGAHKTTTIGVLAREDIERNHRGALDPRSDCFALAGNPVHDGVAAILAALRAAGKRIVALNQIVVDGRIERLAIGDPLETLHSLRVAAREIFSHELAAPVDVLHLRVPPPLGHSLYQADKALKNNHRAVRDGGAIVLEAECGDGVGPDAFLALLRQASTYRHACDLVQQQGYRLGDHKAVKLRHLTDPAARGVRVALVTRRVPDEIAKVAGMVRCDTVKQALDHLDAAAAPLNSGLRIEDAGNVVVAARG